MKQRELGHEKDGTPIPGVIEPYCGECRIDFATGRSFCACGYSFEERKASGWALNGEKKS